MTEEEIEEPESDLLWEFRMTFLEVQLVSSPMLQPDLSNQMMALPVKNIL
jgi:hypothetical protein